MIEPQEYQRIKKIAHLVSLACVLQILESLIPYPIPGLRLGLSNIPALIALLSLGFRYALAISVLRTILSSLVMGTFMSVGFALSFSAAFISTLVMGFFWWLSGLSWRYRLSIIGISIAGALSNNLVQLYLAFLLLVKHKGIFVFLPYLSIGAVITGWITGAIAARVYRKLKEMQPEGLNEAAQADYPMPISSHYFSGNSVVHRLPAEVKIISIAILSLLILVFHNFWLYLGLFSLLGVITLFSGLPLTLLFSRCRRYTTLVWVSFLLPLFFNPGTASVHFGITHQGLNIGLLFVLRILFLILTSSLLAMTTSSWQLSRGLLKLVSPLRTLGLPDKKIVTIFSLSWEAVPVFWEIARKNISAENFKKIKNPRNLIYLLSNFIVMLYLETSAAALDRRTSYILEGEK